MYIKYLTNQVFIVTLGLVIQKIHGPWWSRQILEFIPHWPDGLIYDLIGILPSLCGNFVVPLIASALFRLTISYYILRLEQDGDNCILIWRDTDKQIIKYKSQQIIVPQKLTLLWMYLLVATKMLPLVNQKSQRARGPNTIITYQVTLK